MVVRAEEGPGVANVFFSLLKGDLLSDGIGLISHGFLRMLVGIALGSRVLLALMGPDGTLG